MLLAVAGVAAVILLPLAFIGAPIYFAYQAIKDNLKGLGFFGKAIGAFLTWFLVQAAVAIAAAILLPIVVPTVLILFVGLCVWDLARTFVLGVTEGFEKGLFFHVIENFFVDFMKFNFILNRIFNEGAAKEPTLVSGTGSTGTPHLSSANDNNPNWNTTPNNAWNSNSRVTDVTGLANPNLGSLGSYGGSMSSLQRPRYGSLQQPQQVEVSNPDTTLYEHEIARAESLGLGDEVAFYKDLRAKLNLLDQDLINRGNSVQPLANIKCAITKRSYHNSCVV